MVATATNLSGHGFRSRYVRGANHTSKHIHKVDRQEVDPANNIHTKCRIKMKEIKSVGAGIYVARARDETNCT